MLTISQVSEQTGLTPYTIRYYEKIGVLHEPMRSSGGARVYQESEVSYIQCLNKLKNWVYRLRRLRNLLVRAVSWIRFNRERSLLPIVLL